jgi:ABC-type multidrug transport system fused ATPase/permease subunit
VGELTSRIATDINLLQDTLNTTIAEFFRQFITIIIGVGFILYASWQLALWMLAVIPVVALAAVIFGRQVRKLSKRAQDESAKSNAILEEVLMGIFSVKAFTNENYELKRYNQKVDSVAKMSIKKRVVKRCLCVFYCLRAFWSHSLYYLESKNNGTSRNFQMKNFMLLFCTPSLSVPLLLHYPICTVKFKKPLAPLNF